MDGMEFLLFILLVLVWMLATRLYSMSSNHLLIVLNADGRKVRLKVYGTRDDLEMLDQYMTFSQRMFERVMLLKEEAKKLRAKSEGGAA